MEAYKKWIRLNKEYVRSLDSLANGLTWLLPERFSSSEIGPEAVTAFLGIITAINEHIIETTPNQRHICCSEPSYPFPLWISALKDMETLVEVAAEQFYGVEKKWNFIAITEAVKVLLRLALLRDSGYKMILRGGETPNAEKDSGALCPDGKGDFLRHGAQSRIGYLQNHCRQNPWNLEDKALSALSRFGESAKGATEPTWLHGVQRRHVTIEAAASPINKPTLISILSENGLQGGLLVTSEMLFIIRPLIYVLMIRRYGIRSWIPWFASLFIDLTGMGILSRVTSSQHHRKSEYLHLSATEQGEVKRRKLLWLLYVMRDPFFSKYTRRRLENSQKLLEPLPIIGFLTEKVVELIIGAQTRYTYMSGS